MDKKYFKVNTDLYEFNSSENCYKQKNVISFLCPKYNKEDFFNLNPIKIKKQEFCRLMNIYFKGVKHEWKYYLNNDECEFKKIDNFETKDYSLSTNYVLGVDVPYHVIPGKEYLGNLIIVYHWGRIYYHTISYNGYPQGQLITIKEHKLVRWAKLKHCSPVFNKTTKKIM